MSSEPTELLKRLLEASANSPLAEPDPASLDILMTRIHTLFNKPALDTTYEDIAEMMLYFQAKRNLVAQLGRQHADKEPTKRARKTKEPPSFDTEDIGV